MFRTLYRLLAVIPIAISGVALPLSAAEERITGFSSGDTLTIRSSEARVDEQPGIFHFDGGFVLKAADWSLSSDHATLYGKLDDPDTVVLTGSPAKIMVNATSDEQSEVVNGSASKIIYQRNTNSIRMEGNAFIARVDHSMSGGEMEYDIENDHIRAGGDGGVHITIEPD